ncbi:acyltransferase 3 [Pseudodesulfovibrio mercurii]|uniref:Acyltransferase 3 n=1 Tax=Pseudodesulfovibrio mercurii TaxID=641491 RepID=F0JH52_9BACT|nr:acyltransferase family protein [Pseudodesulfovibrio mercurii]EGB13991.1 acyltransferase 3 [Pseudodesulfovibrio mercurii]
MIEYRREIDGLRAVAVLGVLFFHLGWAGFSGGWLGVDIFFVISGYLISSLLLEESRVSGTVSLSAFYLRRARRILPALLISLIGSYPMALLVARTHVFTEYCQSFFAALFSVSNIFFWQKTGYFAVSSTLSPLLHTWTLGIEEQFYLIIPSCFLLLAGGTSRRKWAVIGSLFLAMVASFLVCRYGGDVLSYEFRFYMLPTRMWELLLGLFTAVLLADRRFFRKRSILTELLSVTAFGVIGFAFVYYRGGSHFAEKSLFTALAATLFLITTGERHLLGRLLCLKPMQVIGKISYSVYLWHWPFIFLGNLMVLKYGYTSTIYSDLALVAATICLSYVSWRYVERPFRRIISWTVCLRRLAPLAVVAVALAGYGLAYLGGDKGTYVLREDGRADFTSWNGAREGHYFHVGPKGAPRFLLIGDSHAWSTSPALMRLAEEYAVPGEAAMKDGTGPLENIRRSHKLGDPPFAHEWLRYALERKIPNVILVAKWDRYYLTDKWKYFGAQPEWNVSTAMLELRQTVRRLLDNGSRVWIMEQVPQFSKDPIVMTRILSRPYVEEVSTEQRHFAGAALGDIHDLAFHLLDPWPLLLRDGRLSSVRDGAFLYMDENHLSTDGAIAIQEVFRPAFESMRQ